MLVSSGVGLFLQALGRRDFSVIPLHDFCELEAGVGVALFTFQSGAFFASVFGCAVWCLFYSS